MYINHYFCTDTTEKKDDYGLITRFVTRLTINF